MRTPQPLCSHPVQPFRRPMRGARPRPKQDRCSLGRTDVRAAGDPVPGRDPRGRCDLRHRSLAGRDRTTRRSATPGCRWHPACRLRPTRMSHIGAELVAGGLRTVGSRSGALTSAKVSADGVAEGLRAARRPAAGRGDPGAATASEAGHRFREFGRWLQAGTRWRLRQKVTSRTRHYGRIVSTHGMGRFAHMLFR